MENNRIHIGNLVHEHLAQQERTVAWLARQLNRDCSNLHKQLKNRYLTTEMLVEISKVLKVDFFKYYSALIKI